MNSKLKSLIFLITLLFYLFDYIQLKSTKTHLATTRSTTTLKKSKSTTKKKIPTTSIAVSKLSTCLILNDDTSYSSKCDSSCYFYKYVGI